MAVGAVYLTKERLMVYWILDWLVLSVSVFVVTKILKAVYIRDFATALIVALVYGVLKLFLGKLLVILSLPFMVVTLGLFYFVINAFLLWLTDKLIDGFEIKGFLNAIVAALLIWGD
jgi:putative membrane protein